MDRYSNWGLATPSSCNDALLTFRGWGRLIVVMQFPGLSPRRGRQAVIRLNLDAARFWGMCGVPWSVCRAPCGFQIVKVVIVMKCRQHFLFDVTYGHVITSSWMTSLLGVLTRLSFLKRAPGLKFLRTTFLRHLLGHCELWRAGIDGLWPDPSRFYWCTYGVMHWNISRF